MFNAEQYNVYLYHVHTVCTLLNVDPVVGLSRLEL